MLTGFGLFRIPVYDSGDFLVEDSVVNVGFFGVEVFVKRCSDHTVRVDGDSKFASYLIEIGIIPSISSFVWKYKEVTSIINILLKVLNFGGGEGVFGCG